MKKFNYKSILWLLIGIPYLLAVPAFLWYKQVLRDIPKTTIVIVSKHDKTLSLYDYRGNLIQKSQVACGKNAGNKKVKGDKKTPEGVFEVTEINNSSGWSHDFKGDNLDEIEGAYGPYFIRLRVPGVKGIGIHGTHDDTSLGKRASEGCIRMKNSELEKLVGRLSKESLVIITPGCADIISDNK